MTQECRECNVKLTHKMSCSSKGLPLLNSEHKEYQTKIKELQAEIEQIHASALRKATGVINKSELDEETKKELIYLIWK